MYTNISKQSPRKRTGFTLVELLVAIAIIGVLVGMVLFSLAGAQTDSKITRTKGTIEKINSVILEEWEKYRYRAARLDIDGNLLRPEKALGGQPRLSPREGARMRMIVLRDLMRMEMPDRWPDILSPPTNYKAALFTYDNVDGVMNNDAPYYVGERVVPGKLNIYRAGLRSSLRRLAPGVQVPAFTSPTTVAVSEYPRMNQLPVELLTHGGAELLYMIVANANYSGGSALEGFRSSEIGDIDEDGLPEFLDAWGNPITWIRWPSGFSSPLNTPFNPESNAGNSDAMDPLRTDWRFAFDNWRFPAPDDDQKAKPWLLVPLVASAGPDGVFDLLFDIPGQDLNYATQLWAGPTNSPSHRQGGGYNFLDPYIGSYDSSGTYTGAGLGSIYDANSDGDDSVDNVTNYSLILE